VRMPFYLSRYITHCPSQMLKLTPFSSLSSLLVVSMLAFQADLDSPVVVTATFWRARNWRFVLWLEIIPFHLSPSQIVLRQEAPVRQTEARAQRINTIFMTLAIYPLI
jgi:hypothetical protein